MKKIVIERGNEFKVCENIIEKEEDIFGEIYERAHGVERQLASYAARVQEGVHSEYLNNVIAFCGERGQGKSTAMQSFIRQMQEEEQGKKEILEIIDPTAMELAHDMVDIIVSRLFTRFQADKENMDTERQLHFIKHFQRIHRSMSVLKNSGKFIEKEYAYNSSVQNLSDIADSMNLKKDIRVLVQDYLRYIDKTMLVIPIDDLDLNLRDAYKVAEQIRKYFVIPEILIVMAVNIEQMTLCVEQELLREIQGLKDSGRWEIGREARNMSNKYLEKLIPLVRRLVLPDVQAIAEDGENAVRVIYRDSSTDEPQILVDSGELGIEKQVLQLICSRTGLVFPAEPGEVHPFVPHTLRELVNLISLLGDMGEDKRENLELFEQYFCDSWLESNLSDAYAAFIRRLRNTRPGAMHQDAFLFLYGLLDKEVLKLQSDLSVEVQKAFLRNQKGEGKLTNGDLVNCMRLVQLGRESETGRLVTAVGAVFSIRMLKLKESSADEALYDFIGGNIFGAYQLMRTAADGSRRMRFTYWVKPFLDRECGAVSGVFSVSRVKAAAKQRDQDLYKILRWMGAVSDFLDADGNVRTMVSENNQIANRAEFCLDNLFTAGISSRKILEKISAQKWEFPADTGEQEGSAFSSQLPEIWKTVACNMEMAMRLGEYAEKRNDLRGRAREEDYYIGFFDMMNQWLAEQNQYLRQETWAKQLSEGGFFNTEYYLRLAARIVRMKNADNPENGSENAPEGEKTDFSEFENETLIAIPQTPSPAHNSWKTRTLIINMEAMKLQFQAYLGGREDQEVEKALADLEALKQVVGSLRTAGVQGIGEKLRKKYNSLWSVWNKTVNKG